MKPNEYKTRIQALGFETYKSWADYVGIHVVTHQKHIAGDRKIPKPLIKIVEWLESGKLENPNGDKNGIN